MNAWKPPFFSALPAGRSEAEGGLGAGRGFMKNRRGKEKMKNEMKDEKERRIAEPEGSAVLNWLLKGSQQNYYVSRKGIGALTKTNPVPHLEFYFFGFQMENNSQKHNFVVARLCEPMRFPDVPRTIITTRPN
jgi:hypothetical protein